MANTNKDSTGLGKGKSLRLSVFEFAVEVADKRTNYCIEKKMQEQRYSETSFCNYVAVCGCITPDNKTSRDDCH